MLTKALLIDRRPFRTYCILNALVLFLFFLSVTLVFKVLVKEQLIHDLKYRVIAL